MRYPAQIFDHLQYLYHTTGFNDHQLHCVIRFENHINEKVMEKAVISLVQTLPVLSRAYVPFEGESYWEDMNPDRQKGIFQIVETEKEFNEFTCSQTELSGPQIRVCLFKSKEDALSIIVNHMVTDGAGMKQCIYLLAELYSKRLSNPEYTSDYCFDNDRSFRKVISSLRFRDKLRIFLLNKKDNNQISNDIFPMSEDNNIRPFLLTHELQRDRFQVLKAYAKKNNVTINDIMMTAYFRVLSNLLDCRNQELKIPIMIDMRRYLEDKSFHTLTNLSSTVIISASVNREETFEETLRKINAQMNEKKDNYLGMSTFLKLSVLYKICGKKVGYQLLQKSLHNPSICMTNIGVIDTELLDFKDSPIQSAFICGSIKYRPHFQLAISSFNQKMTLCVNLYGSREDQDKFQTFLNRMDQELYRLPD